MEFSAFEAEPVPLQKKRFDLKKAFRRILPSLPILAWFPGRTKDWRQNALGDCIAGITVGILLIPQGMAYALIVNMDPVFGLYAGFLPAVVYSFFGSSGQISVGPVALMSVLAQEGVEHLEDPELNKERYQGLMACLALQTGFISFCMGAFGLGAITDLLSHPVIEGFTMAGAILIGSKQLQYIFGISARDSNFFKLLEKVVTSLKYTRWQTVLYSLATIMFLWTMRKYKRSKFKWAKKMKLFPDVLIVLVIAIPLSTYFPSDMVDVIGEIPSGLPPFTVPLIDQDFVNLLPTAFIIAILGFIESYTVGSKFAIMFKYNLEGGKELVGLGYANMLPAFFRIFPVAGSFSRTALAGQAGARTPAQLWYTALVILFTLEFLTPLFTNTPYAVLGGIVFVAVSGLFQPNVAVHLWKTKLSDFVVMMFTCILILVIGVDLGVFIGVFLSYITPVVLKSAFPGMITLRDQFPYVTIRRARRSSISEDDFVQPRFHNPFRPPMSVMGWETKTKILRSINGHMSEHKIVRGISVLRVATTVHFSNFTRVANRLNQLIDTYRDSPDAEQIHTIIIDASHLRTMDQTAAHNFGALRIRLDAHLSGSVKLRFACCNAEVIHLLQSEFFFGTKPDKDNRYFDSIEDAVREMLKQYQDREAKLAADNGNIAIRKPKPKNYELVAITELESQHDSLDMAVAGDGPINTTSDDVVG